jgi:hypothetical protein
MNNLLDSEVAFCLGAIFKLFNWLAKEGSFLTNKFILLSKSSNNCLSSKTCKPEGLNGDLAENASSG